jgi:hypothetical protein
VYLGIISGDGSTFQTLGVSRCSAQNTFFTVKILRNVTPLLQLLSGSENHGILLKHSSLSPHSIQERRLLGNM